MRSKQMIDTRGKQMKPASRKGGRPWIVHFIKDIGGFGMNELLSIAAALIIAGFVIIPGLRFFAEDLMEGLADWWSNTIASKIFLAS